MPADNPKQPYAIANTSPAIDLVAAIPACETNVNVRPGQCWDMFYTPNTSAAAQVRLGGGGAVQASGFGFGNGALSCCCMSVSHAVP
jgi:hypothetical protein